MCFSAAASFTAAAVTGAAGIVSLTRIKDRSEAALAAVPLGFALQQAVEGGVWLSLPAGGAAGALALAFVIIAEVGWPLAAPAVAFFVEARRVRKRIILALWLIGLGVAAYLLRSILARPPTPAIIGSHVAYLGQDAQPWPVVAAYVVATAGALVVSSRWVLKALGGVVLAGYAASAWLAAEAFLSIWCFFAAVGSLTILAYFLARRPPLKPSAAAA